MCCDVQSTPAYPVLELVWLRSALPAAAWKAIGRMMRIQISFEVGQQMDLYSTDVSAIV